MSNNFKNTIRDRYKGRGNCWVKVPQESSVYSEIIKLLKNEESKEYTAHIEREGFAWMRFSKPTGSKEEPRALFEIRYRGSKIDHPDCVLNLLDSDVKDLPILGNTPVKLQLEVDPDKRKNVLQNKKAKESKVKNNSIKENNSNENENKIVEIISEATLTKSSEKELREWERFLELEGLLN
jgi:hypothetical protein